MMSYLAGHADLKKYLSVDALAMVQRGQAIAQVRGRPWYYSCGAGFVDLPTSNSFVVTETSAYISEDGIIGQAVCP